MVTKSEAVDTQWANVENVFQRRADLIPNLVNTVKGYADFEKETLTQVIAAIPLLFIFLGLLFPDQQKGMTIMSAGGAGQSAIK